MLNEVAHRLKPFDTVTSSDCLRAESNVVNDYASVVFARYGYGCVCGFRVERKVRHMRAVEGCVFVVFPTSPGQSQVQFYSGLHALANRLVLHVFSSSHCVIFANVTFCSLVCSLFATWLSPCIMHGDCSSWCTRPTSQFTGHRMRLLKSNAELDMLSAFKSFLTLMFLCC